MLLADKAYDANALCDAFAQRNTWANIPPKRNRKDPTCCSKYLYKMRTWPNAFSIKSNTTAASPPDTTKSPKTSKPACSSPLCLLATR
jgi:hypothetical protein